ncbi:MAG: hypothetical protein ACREVL_19805, partial [Solimonas sp.]
PYTSMSHLGFRLVMDESAWQQQKRASARTADRDAVADRHAKRAVSESPPAKSLSSGAPA